MNKKSLLTIAAVTVLGAGALSATSAFAQTNNAGQDQMSSLVEKIASKFNLNQDDVQAVFDEAHEERETQMKATFEAQLTQAVTDGEIISEQKQLILDKRAEMEADREANHDSFESQTPEERKAAMESKKSELDSWATQNGIDVKYLMPQHGDRGPHGGPGGFDHPDDDRDEATESTDK